MTLTLMAFWKVLKAEWMEFLVRCTCLVLTFVVHNYHFVSLIIIYIYLCELARVGLKSSGTEIELINNCVSYLESICDGGSPKVDK